MRQGTGNRGVAVAIGIMVLAAYLLVRGMAGTLTAEIRHVASDDEAQLAVSAAAGRLRMIGYHHSGADASVIYAGPDETDFYSDLQAAGTPQCYRIYLGDGRIHQARADGPSCALFIRFAAGGPIVTAAGPGPGSITALRFSYYSAADAGGSPLVGVPLAADRRWLIRRIGITAVTTNTRDGTAAAIATESVIRATR